MPRPQRLAHLDPLVLTALEQIITGPDGHADWGRVTLKDGAPIVNNRSSTYQPGATLQRPERKPPKRITRVELPPGRETAKRLATEAPSAQPRPPAPEAPVAAPVTPRLMATRPPRPPRSTPPARPRATPPAAPVFAAPPTILPSPDVVEKTAAGLQAEYAGGLPDELEVTISEVVSSWPGYDADIVDDVLRHPTRVEIAPETATKGFPVLRFWRGGVCVVLFFPPDQPPTVPAWYATWNDIRQVAPRALTGGGGPRKSVGMPTRPRDLERRLVEMGAEVTHDEERGLATVTYKGHEMGTFKVYGANPRQVADDWQKLSGKVNRAYQRHLAGKRPS